MKLTKLHIKNFKSCKDVQLDIDNMHAIVGSNNSGKSSVLKAMDFLFNPSTKTLDEECFWNKETNLELRVEATFEQLSENEKAELSAYLKDDGSFTMARYVTQVTGSEQDDTKFTIGQQYKKLFPKIEWLNNECINTENIKGWWKDKESLVLNGVSFSELFESGKVPTVKLWKENAMKFIENYRNIVPLEERWGDNPQGYAGVLKGTLPLFVLIPAVRDVTEECKVTKSNPFGKLLNALFISIPDDQKAEITTVLTNAGRQFNRTGGESRVSKIVETERHLNKLLNDFFDNCDLEIEFDIPTVETLFSSPKLFINDGFRTSVENKGHGLQRAVIFAVLRQYAGHMTISDNQTNRKLILAVEEPEIYMHPQAQRTIRNLFRTIANEGDQVIFTTHSSLLVDVAYFDEIIRMEAGFESCEEKTTKHCHAYQLKMSDLIKDIELRHPKVKGKVTPDSMRDIYSNAYNPRRNEGFFASKVILVEGATEEYSIPIYAEPILGCSLDSKNISVLECGGKGVIDRLYRIFNELHIACYILFDYDKNSAEKNNKKKNIELLGFFGFSEPQEVSLFISDSVAYFPTKWEVTCQEEVENYTDLKAEATNSFGLSDSDLGKPLMSRFIARKLVSQDPPFIPSSIKAIIEKAVDVEWQESCLETE